MTDFGLGDNATDETTLLKYLKHHGMLEHTPTPGSPMTKIVELRAENIKRLSAVHITPDGSTVVIGGMNAQGKSSVLDSIVYALGGSKYIPSKPLRKGQDQGKIEIDLGELIVTRTFLRRPDGSIKTELEVKSKDGYEAPTPQTILNDMCGKMAFDPLAFSRLDPKKQADQLKELVGLDFSQLDAEYKSTFDKRTEVNREGKNLKARFDSMPHFDDAPAEEISVQQLMQELKRRQTLERDNSQKRAELRQAETQIEVLQSDCQEIENEIARLQEKLAQKQAQIRAAVIAREPLAAAVQALTDPDIDEVQQKIESAESINRKVRGNAARQALAGELDSFRTKSQMLTDRLKAIEAEKANAMKAAKFPVEGLGFDADGVTFNGLPFEQASSAEQLDVAVAMGFAQHPELRIALIRDGSLLDHTMLARVAKVAEQFDGQVWIERVSEGAECSVIISDGHVVEQPAEELATA